MKSSAKHESCVIEVPQGVHDRSSLHLDGYACRTGIHHGSASSAVQTTLPRPTLAFHARGLVHGQSQHAISSHLQSVLTRDRIRLEATQDSSRKSGDSSRKSGSAKPLSSRITKKQPGCNSFNPLEGIYSDILSLLKLGTPPSERF